MGITVLFISVASMGGVGLVLAIILAVADKKLAVEEDPRVTKAIDLLPGANCGACGFAGCNAYANALVEGKVSISACKPGGNEVSRKLAELLGIEEVEEMSPKVARVFCSGGLKEAVSSRVYTGVKTCAAAHLIGGEKACVYSCIGYGDCVAACPFDAIDMGENGLPVIDLERCTGCGECVKACPRYIIKLTGYEEVVHIYCSSHDKGAVVRKVCSAGCIACGLCEKDDDTGAVTMKDELAVVDHGVDKAPVLAAKRCPTKVIRISDPAPGYEDLFKKAQERLEAAVRDEEAIKAAKAAKKSKESQ
jgi:electron transport complex protein RnfB